MILGAQEIITMVCDYTLHFTDNLNLDMLKNDYFWFLKVLKPD